MKQQIRHFQRREGGLSTRSPAPLLISVAVVWYVIYNVQPSSSCGPFGDVAQSVYACIIQIIQDTKLYPLKDIGKILCIRPL